MRSRPSGQAAAAVEMIQAEGAGLVLGYFRFLHVLPFMKKLNSYGSLWKRLACQRVGQSGDL